LLVFLVACKSCPDTCDDRKACTRDYCGSDTDYYCEHEIIEDCTCGDSECDLDIGENKCTCPSDCGQCKGDVDKSVEYACVEDECVTALKSSVAIEDITKIGNLNMKGFQTTVKNTFQKPFNLPTSNMNTVIRLENQDKGVKNLVITHVIFKDDLDVFIAENQLNKPISSIGSSISFDTSFGNYTLIGDRKERSIYAEIYFKYILIDRTGDIEKRDRERFKIDSVPFLSAQVGKRV